MKKFLSMLLVLTMVVTTLMGVMVTDVSAVSFSRDADTKEITLSFGSKTLPAALAAWNSFSVGNWYGHGYNYAESDIDAFFAGTATTITGTATEKVNYLETAVVDNALDPITGQMTKYDFKHSTITDGSKAALDYASGKSYDTTKLFTQSSSAGKISPNYNRLSVFPQPLGSSSSKSYSFGSITQDQINATATDNTAYVFTFYAYTQNVDATRSGSTISFELRNPNSSISINAADLVSENGVPHKVDIVLTSDGAATPKHRAHLYIDGVDKSAKAYTTSSTAIAFQPRFELNSLASSGTMNIGETDWYITQFNAKTNFVSTPRADVNAALINVPNYTNVNIATAYRTDDYITGVIDSLDADIKAVLETTEVGDKIVDITESKYNNPASLYTDTTDTANTTVKLISRTTGDEVAVADATGTMDDYYLMVEDIYVIPNKVADPAPYVVADGTPFTAGNNVVTLRARQENYVDYEYTDEVPFGGLTSGFYRFTNEPRSGFTFDASNIKYNEAGYVAMDMYNGGNSVANSSSALTKYDVEKNIATAEFDLYIPEYTASSSSSYRIAIALFDGGWGTSNRKTTNVYFTTGGLGTLSNSNAIDLEPNAWSTISMQFDMTNAVNDGICKLHMYVNGNLVKTINCAGDYTAEAATNFAPLAYMRFYSPTYLPYGTLGGGKWYMGDYTPGATAVATGTITENDDNITVNEDAQTIVSTYETDAELIDAMEGYTPVYTSIVDIDAVNAAYNDIDGTTPVAVTVEGATKAYKGKLIKKYVENSGWFDVTYGAEGELNTYTVTTTPPGGQSTDKLAYLLSATDNGDGTATLAFASNSFADATVYDGVATQLPTILADIDGAQTNTLVGFAVNETGKLPKVYTLIENGLELRTLTYNLEANQAELGYREYNAAAEDSYTFQLIVAAYNENGKLLDLKAGTSTTITGAGADGEYTITLAPEFTDEVIGDTSYYKVFVFESLTGGKPVMASVKVSK